MRAALPILLLALTAACRPAPETPERTALRIMDESAKAQTAIDAINIRYMRYMNGNMADSVASLFLEDGVLMPPNMPAVVGREEIRRFFAESPLPPGAAYTFMAADVVANGPELVERGEFSLALPANGRTPAATVTGKYLVHWRDVGGRWLQAATIWNEDAPVAP